MLSLLLPGLSQNVINVSALIFVAVRVDLVVAAEERSLVERVLLRHVASFGDVVHLRVENVTRSAAVAVLLATENQHLTIADRTGTKPVLDVVLKALRPDLDQLPVELVARLCVQTLDVSD